MDLSLILGAGSCAAAVGLAVWLLTGSRLARVPRSRLDPSAAPAPTRFAGAVGDTTAVAERLLRRSGRRDALEAALERAGIRRRPAEVVVLTAAATAVAALLGSVLGGPLLGLLCAVLAPVGAKAVVDTRRARRQAAFAEQLDDTLHLMASSLRAGHSVLRAVDAVSHDADAPTSEEFSRVVNETRVGRDVNGALQEVAERTGSQDFEWVVQAIAIHREVGGNLAEILDRVGATIRERSQLRRQARTLSAEGRLSGIVLMAMPVVVFGLLRVIAPSYAAQLTGTGAGRVLLVLAVALMVAGGFWLRATVKVRY